MISRSNHQIVADIPTPEFDYVMLMNQLGAYRYPRDKIKQLLKKGVILRVKKGIYIKARGDYHPFILANMISGPSYVSLESALSYHGLIPERVYTVTSTTLTRNRSFDTPVGRFEYRSLPVDLYAIGIERKIVDGSRSFLIASPEKAIFDRLWRETGLDSASELEEYLCENLRIDISEIHYSKTRLSQLCRRSSKPFCNHLEDVLSKAKP